MLLVDDAVAEVAPDEMAAILATSTAGDYGARPDLGAALVLAAAKRRVRQSETEATFSSYDEHVESLLADHADLSGQLERVRRDWEADRAELARAQQQLRLIEQSRSYRLGRTVRRITG